MFERLEIKKKFFSNPIKNKQAQNVKKQFSNASEKLLANKIFNLSSSKDKCR